MAHKRECAFACCKVAHEIDSAWGVDLMGESKGRSLAMMKITKWKSTLERKGSAPGRIRTDTVWVLNPLPAASWATGAFEVKDTGSLP